MNYEKTDELNNDYNNSFENSKDNCYINNYPIKNYLNNGISHENSNYYNIDGEYQNEFKKNYNKTRICNLNDPKLIQAYNEGYYGVQNVPKQYYIYPKFSNYDLNNEKYKSYNNNFGNSHENNYDIFYNKNQSKYFNNNLKNSSNNKNYDTLSSYANYPYPKLINISSNLFGIFHSTNLKQNNELENLATNSSNKVVNKNDELKEKEIQNKNNINDMNKNLSDITFKNKENKSIKSSEKIIVEKNNEKNEENKNISTKINKIDNYENNTKLNNNINDDYNDIFDSGNFYFINNSATNRTVPYKNLPDNISFDDEEEEE